MDSSLTIRPAASIARTSGMRRDGAVHSAVATDLAPSQTVTAAPTAIAVRNDTVRAAPLEPSDVATIILDAQSREVIYRTINVRSSRIVRQTPKEALLRLKAYAHAEPEDEPDTQSFEKTV